MVEFRLQDASGHEPQGVSSNAQSSEGQRTLGKGIDAGVNKACISPRDMVLTGLKLSRLHTRSGR